MTAVFQATSSAVSRAANGAPTSTSRPKAAEIRAFLAGAALTWLHDRRTGDLRTLVGTYLDDQLAVLRSDHDPAP